MPPAMAIMPLQKVEVIFVIILKASPFARAENLVVAILFFDPLWNPLLISSELNYLLIIAPVHRRLATGKFPRILQYD